MSRTVAPPRVLNIDDLRREARRRLPRVVFDYIDGGAERGVHAPRERRAFDDVRFRPRSAVATRPVRPARPTVLGTRLELPFMLAPVGSSRMFYPRGEEAAARAAGEGRHGLHPLHAVGVPARGREGGHRAARPGISSTWWAAATWR